MSIIYISIFPLRPPFKKVSTKDTKACVSMSLQCLYFHIMKDKPAKYDIR